MEEHPGGQKGFRIGRVCTKRTPAATATPPGCCRRRWPRSATTRAASTAQTYLADMYGHHGFVRDGEEFLDDGIPHVPMVKP